MITTLRSKRNAAALGCAALLLTLGACSQLSEPKVVSTTPVNGATDVALGSNVTATFSKAMLESSLNTTTFTVSQGSTKIVGEVSYSGLTATFNPAQNLLPGTLYRATVTTGAQAGAKTEDEDGFIVGGPAGRTPVEGEDEYEPRRHPHFFAWLLGGLFVGNLFNNGPDTALSDDFSWSFTTATAGGDTTAPTVISVTPDANATGVGLGVNLTASFSEAMDSASINNTSFRLSLGSTPVAGTVTYSGTTATFNPLGSLLPGSQYTARITTSAEDLAGNRLASERTWSFSTSGAGDTTAPTVSFTSPHNGTTGVPVSNRLSATFSEAMSPLTLNSTTFTLRQDDTPVAGIVRYTGITATFAPVVALLPSTFYTATLTTGAQDLAGNAMETNFVWNFTTGNEADSEAPTVTFVTPEDGSTDVLLSRSFSVSFSEVMDTETINGSTFTITRGSVSVEGEVTAAGIFGIFNPTTALLPDTLYTATITTGAKDLAGNSLVAPFVWSFTTTGADDETAPVVSATTPANGETGVLLGRNLTAIFSEQMDPLTINSATFILRRGSVPVVGGVSYSGVTAVFNPLTALLPSTLYTATINTGARDLAGNALAEDRLWTFTTGALPDTAAPTVLSTDPSDGATNVALNKSVSATFSEAMNPLTVNTVSFSLKRGAVAVPGTVTLSGNIAVLNPLATLLANTEYTATITTAARDLAGNAIATNRVWSFTTGAAADSSAPTVVSTDPSDGATNVALNKSISATFSEAMNPLTVNAGSFTLRRGAVTVAGTISLSDNIAVFDPLLSLNADTVYTASISTAARDLAGNSLAANRVWTFTTGVEVDTSAPTVISNDPLDGAIGVPLNKSISVTFSEEMDPLTINAGSFTVSNGSAPVAGIVSFSGVNALFDPLALLTPDTTYTVTIDESVRDASGNALESSIEWTFSTGLTTAQGSISLGAANGFAILAGSTVTSTGNSIVTGDLGVSPGEAVAGFPPAVLVGEMFTGVGSAAGEAKEDLTEAFNEAASRSEGSVTLPGDLSGLTLFPGLYTNSTSVMLSSGACTLDAQGDSNAVFLLQMGSTLTAGSNTQIILSGGARAENVYWQVGTSATLGTNSVFKGNVLAASSITLATGASLEGRALTQTAAVTLDAAIITAPLG